MNKFIEIIFRKKTMIKSRQWWLKATLKAYRSLTKYLPTAKKQLLKNSQLTLLITNNNEIKLLNFKFRKINKPTDVLSFSPNKKVLLMKKYLGDIAISIEKAKTQAKEEGISLEKELLILLTHGYLHLLGYDHKEKKEEKIMFSLQKKILLGIIKR